jgi:hypothetical protein
MLGFQTIHHFLNGFSSKELLKRFVFINLLENFNSLKNINNITVDDVYVNYLFQKLKTVLTKEQRIQLVFSSILYYDQKYDFSSQSYLDNYHKGLRNIKDIIYECIQEVINLPFYKDYISQTKPDIYIPYDSVPRDSKFFLYNDVTKLKQPSSFSYTVDDLFFIDYSITAKTKEQYKTVNASIVEIQKMPEWFKDIIKSVAQYCEYNEQFLGPLSFVSPMDLRNAYNLGASTAFLNLNALISLVKYYIELHDGRFNIEQAKELGLLYEKEKTEKFYFSMNITNPGELIAESVAIRRIIEATLFAIKNVNLSSRLNMKLLPSDDNFSGLTQLVSGTKEFQLLQIMYKPQAIFSGIVDQETIKKQLSQINQEIYNFKEFQYTSYENGVANTIVFLTLYENLNSMKKYSFDNFDNKIQQAVLNIMTNQVPIIINDLLAFKFIKPASTILENINSDEALKDNAAYQASLAQFNNFGEQHI